MKIADLESVIQGIECTGFPNALCLKCGYFRKYNDGGYSGQYCDRDAIYEDALELLKAQVPRVMTLEDVKQWDEQATHEKEPVYVDNIHEPDYTWAYVGKFNDPYDGYGISWRCWTARPSDKQREETQWEK